jgi:peptidoglycan hydrolase CwlO-like protein
MESLENRLTNMKSIIEDRDNRITKKNEEILKLREEIQLLRKRYEYDN